MTIRVSRDDWRNEAFRNATLLLAESFGTDVEIEVPKKEHLPYQVQIWLGDDVTEASEFTRKADALKWSKERLSDPKNAGGVADVKKYNKAGDDFDWQFYVLSEGRLEETYDF